MHTFFVFRGRSLIGFTEGLGSPGLHNVLLVVLAQGTQEAPMMKSSAHTSTTADQLPTAVLSSLVDYSIV